MSLADSGRVSAHKSLLAFLALLPVALVSAAACGGSAFETRNGIAGSNGFSGANSSGSGGSSAGAGQNVAGQSSGEAGSATGHAGSGSAGSGAGGAVGQGGWGNAGSANGGSGGSDVTTCTSNAQCEVVPISCCSCGLLGPAEDFTAINSAYQAQFDFRCAAVDCAGCPPMRAPLPSDPYFALAATCQRATGAGPNAAGHCVVVDLRKTDITACKLASDCTLRSGTACCSGCSGVPVAINGNQGSALSDLVCGGDPIGCPLCLPTFDGFKATCSDGRCAVATTL